MCLALYAKNRLGVAVKSHIPTADPVLSCSQISVDKIQSRVAGIEAEKNALATSTRSLMGLSTEGGEEITYTTREGQRVLIHQAIYGETFQAEVKYYLRKIGYFS
jgi:hypothetical protein